MIDEFFVKYTKLWYIIVYIAALESLYDLDLLFPNIGIVLL